MNWKGIVLAGGRGTRLYPLTRAASKQLLPIYDKPMIYYPLSVLMLAGIREILIVSTPQDLPQFVKLLGDGSGLGLDLHYIEQPKPGGLPEAFILGAEFIGSSNVSLVLGDNVFFGQGLKEKLDAALGRTRGATIFGYRVKNPERFGVVALDRAFRPISIEEKPKAPCSPYAVTGLYFYDNDVIGLARRLRPSNRNELEITDLNRSYLERGDLHVEIFGRGFAWLDAGTHESLIEASQFIQTVEHRQGLKVACLEEIACRNGWISPAQLAEMGERLESTPYGSYLLEIAAELGESAGRGAS